MIKKTFRALLLGCSLLSATCWAELSPLEVMNMAGLQRSLGQIVAKDYLMIGSGVKVDEAIEQRAKSLALFENHHAQLKAVAPNDAIRAALDAVDQLWADYHALASATPDKAQAPVVLAKAEELVKQCQAVTDLFEQHNGDAASHAINRSGWNRVLTQRTAMFYMARAWGVEAPGLDAKFEASVKEFDAIMAELQADGAPNAEIAEALRKAEARWQFASRAFASEEFVPTIVAVNAESMFRQLNEMTRLYAGLREYKL
ncbi:hypothetical protein DN826_14260 [Stutzerimonas nosocomialis]|uniref:type IV pili methyl-accepting chemotaxis transducer N-terminal domain-containing protein n=1 Tax=Stutzerimonas nosocomialis TaxID=1056496 RepID=UPI001109B7C0|nr:type IV pili methyl-accepting chemotaxis transducer N-terminal domain-containing protein [Stutzerimonas nosocomialis]TLX54342.1 hypothetical protein DN826_14260 [Stutzerimonas nosocomialis]